MERAETGNSIRVQVKSDNVVGFGKTRKKKAPLYRRGGKGKRMETNLAYKLEEDVEEEIIGGRVVMMASPTMNHIFIAGNIYNLFFNYLRGKKCTPFPSFWETRRNTSRT